MLDKINHKQALSYEEAFVLADDVLNKRISDDRIETLLLKLNEKGETYHEIAGFANAMKKNAKRFTADSSKIMDTCGTGGDGLETFNISTAVAFVMAAAGVKVVKHGNRSVSSKCGSADLLEAMGIDLNLKANESERLFKEEGFCFLFAQAYHTKMKEIMPIRRKIGKASIFNIIGPLSNPAKVTHQIIGVYNRRLLKPVFEAMKTIGLEAGAAIYGFGGMDELSLEGENEVLIFKGDEEKQIIINPRHYGFNSIKNDQLKGGMADLNLKIMKSILEGQPSPYKEAVILNAGFCLYLDGAVNNMKEGVESARNLIDTGLVKQKVDRIIAAQDKIKNRNILDEIYEYKKEAFEKQAEAIGTKVKVITSPFYKERKKMSQLLLAYKRDYIKETVPKQYPIIGEIKRGSPSKGQFTNQIELEKVVTQYENLKVIGFSVLADQKYFFAEENDVRDVGMLTNKPILYKEFIVSKTQIEMCKAEGASVILLIAKMLPYEALKQFTVFAHALNLEVLMEIHTKEDFEKVKDIPFDILGINNRDLNTFKTDLSISVELYKALNLQSLTVPVISESGIYRKNDIEKLLEVGFHGVLMGEHLIRSVIKTGIKICGINKVEDAIYASKEGVDYIGLVFAESKRKIDIPSAKAIVEALENENTKCVAVFKDQGVDEINHILKAVPVDMIQIHGKFEDYEALSFKTPIIRAFTQEEVVALIDKNKALESHSRVSHHLIDATVPGSGKAFNWAIIKQINSNKPLIIAGGLNPDNVPELIKDYHPFAVDVSSGVELEGQKNQNKMKAFIDSCLSADVCKQI